MRFLPVLLALERHRGGVGVLIGGAVGGRDSVLIDDGELLTRVAAIDVAKASGMVCVRVPAERGAGSRDQRVWQVAATTGAVMELADTLVASQVERVVMESTGTYWKPFFYLLEAAGLQVWLVNARDVRNVPGRPKTDKLDAVWLAKLTERGMLRPSFVPPKAVRQLRDLTRMRAVLVRERTRHRQRMESLLEDAQIKISSVLADIWASSGRLMIEALVAGQRDPQVLADLVCGRLKSTREQRVEALRGVFEEHHAYLAGMLMEMADHLTGKIEELTGRIETAIAAMAGQADAAPGACVLDRLDQIPGIGRVAAQTIIAEIGLDMTRFPTPEHLTAWARFCPRTIQSGPKTAAGATGAGNPWLAAAMGGTAVAASRTSTFFSSRYKRLVARRGKKRALVALARSQLVVIWHLLSDPETRYTELGADFHARLSDPTRKTRELVRQLRALGHHGTLAPANQRDSRLRRDALAPRSPTIFE